MPILDLQNVRFEGDSFKNSPNIFELVSVWCEAKTMSVPCIVLLSFKVNVFASEI